jgi:hypothetical protein
MFDDVKRATEDNPTVEIILCAQRDVSVVRYSVLHGSEQLFASKYKRVLLSEDKLRVERDRERALLRQQTYDSLLDAPSYDASDPHTTPGTNR